MASREGFEIRAPAAALTDQRGLTIVEVMVAAMVLVIGALGVLQVVDASTRNTYRAEQSQVLGNRLQAEMEEIKQLPYGEIALTATPVHSDDPDEPNWRAVGTQFATDREGTNLRPIVSDGSPLEGGGEVSGGAVSPGPEPFESGDVSGEVYRYVVWEDDPSCPESHCPGAQDLKRVIVAVTLDETALGGDRAYQEIQSDLVDPDAEPVDNPGPPGEENETREATFWLTDTPCSFDSRQPIALDPPGSDGHPLHNTRGVCSNGLKTGGTAGAPDLMFTKLPALDPNYPPEGQPLYDYATDVEPAQNPGQDKGLLVRHASANGCLLSGGLADLSLLDLPLLESNKQQKLHKWVSEEIPSGLELLLTGGATLELWTKTVNGASHPGRICVWLFKRTVALNLLGVPVPVDVPVVNLDDPLQVSYFQLSCPGDPGCPSGSSWPTTWTEVSLPLRFLATQLLPGERLGLAITVERGGTQPGDGLEFMYDHADFDSRLAVQTTSLLPIFD